MSVKKYNKVINVKLRERLREIIIETTELCKEERSFLELPGSSDIVQSDAVQR
jgi:hypothetical protein